MISVVVPTHDRAQMLPRALRSVQQQTYTDRELIVVDDGSTDETVRVVRDLGVPVRYLWQSHAGVSAARNRGIAAARGDWVAFLDSDDEWLPTKLARQMACVAVHPEAVACQTDEIWIRNGVRVNPGVRHRKPSGDIFLASLELCLVSPSAVMVRRERLEALGGFDEGLPACEDYDLWLRLAAGASVHLVPELLTVRHGGHADQLSRRHWGMDRFRVAALARLLSTVPLDATRYAHGVSVLVRKCRILGAGARRRGREAEASRYDALAAYYRRGVEVLTRRSPAPERPAALAMDRLDG
jgi:glycosyltransferase involved in cell wall biosynthesis